MLCVTKAFFALSEFQVYCAVGCICVLISMVLNKNSIYKDNSFYLCVK